MLLNVGIYLIFLSCVAAVASWDRDPLGYYNTMTVKESHFNTQFNISSDAEGAKWQNNSAVFQDITTYVDMIPICWILWKKCCLYTLYIMCGDCIYPEVASNKVLLLFRGNKASYDPTCTTYPSGYVFRLLRLPLYQFFGKTTYFIL